MSERPGQSIKYNNSDYGVNEAGERIVLSTRRADGSYRKERRVRAGYVPPDEQVAYVSRGKQVCVLILVSLVRLIVSVSFAHAIEKKGFAVAHGCREGSRTWLRHSRCGRTVMRK
jgi:Mago binding